MTPLKQKFQVIIIGSGGAGLTSALSCVNNGIKNVAVISKVFPTKSHTIAAKGGINAALGNVEQDDWKWHCYDTIKGGDFLVDHDAAEIMCKLAPETILELEKMGVVFSLNQDGKIDQRKYGGQKTQFGKGELAYRACFYKDSTGYSILNGLYQECLNKNIKFFDEFFVSDLLISDDKKKCFGAVAIDLKTGQINIFESRITIIATGGYSQIYKHSTSSDICTGDGTALVLKEGMQLQDMEFVQFHPTSLYGASTLVTEAARGEGGFLVNGKGEKFMQKYAPNYGDLASRDVIARSIATEIHIGNGGGKKKDHVYLDVRHLGEKKIKEKIPGVLEMANSFAKIDPLNELIPIAPAAHYTMGGIPTDIKCRVLFNDKEVSGLLAIGEAACVSVHGANRLGCNSLLDIVVFGKISGKAAKDLLEEVDSFYDQKIVDDKIARINQILSQEGDESESKIKFDLKEIVEEFVGVFRNENLLEKGLSKLLKLREKLNFVKIKNKDLIFNNQIVSFLEVENLLLLAIATTKSALVRQESRGAHYREDFKERDDEKWLKHSLISFDVKNNSFNFSTKEIRVKPIGDEQIIIKPEIRKY